MSRSPFRLKRAAPLLVSRGHIVIIEDEANIAEMIRYNLQQEGFRLSIAGNGEEGLRLAGQRRPDLILLDLLLPKMDGLEVCRRLKQRPETRAIPLIILTAKASEADKVAGLELGADDYITKPFSPRELTARIRAVLRRRMVPETAAVFSCGALEADWERHQISVKGRPVHLTSKELKLVKLLADAGGRVLSREDLLERGWGYDPALEIETRTVDFHISQLRRKLRSEGWRIATVAGRGYKFVEHA